ncbi:hypothetical protein BDW75DRAFT_200116 [Aspergillus navahoensis]
MATLLRVLLFVNFHCRIRYILTKMYKMQYQQPPPQVIVQEEKKDRGCLATCLATIFCCWLCGETCECCFDCLTCCC